MHRNDICSLGDGLSQAPGVRSDVSWPTCGGRARAEEGVIRVRRRSRRHRLVAVWCLLGLLLYHPVANAHHGDHTGPPRTTMPVSQLLEVYECTRCHRLTTPHRLTGPSLWKLGERVDTAAIRASILTPDAVVTPGYPIGLMRLRLQTIGFYDDIARQPDILERLVAYLAGGPEPPVVTPSTPSLAGMVRIPQVLVPQAEGPSRAVPAFTIDAAPVSKAQYAAFIAAGAYTTKRYWDRVGWAVVIRRRQRTQPKGWRAERDAGSAEPVVGINWYEAQAYCRWVGKELPTELQWERACQEVPAWYGPENRGSGHWEWTAEVVWKGGPGRSGTVRPGCAARVPSHRALDGRHTGFRCSTSVNALAP